MDMDATNDEESERRKCSVKIRIDMLPSKLSFFFNDGYFASFSPFLNIFFVSLGLTGTQAGLITGISLAVSVFAGPLWGFLADSTGKRKMIFLILSSGTLITVSSIPWVAKFVATYKVDNCAHNRTLHSKNRTQECQENYHLQNPTELFYTLLFLNIIARSFFGALPCYIDGIITNVVNTREKETSYGHQKVFSPIGFACFNFISGVAIDSFNLKGISSYTAAFLVFLPCILVLIPIGYFLVSQSKWKSRNIEDNKKTGLRTQLFSVCKKPETIVFLLSVCVSGLGLGIFQGFCFLLMKELKTSSKIMTLNVVVGTISQLIVYPFSLRIIRWFKGPIPCIALGIFSYFPNYMLMSYIKDPWLVLTAQLFEGVGVSLSWAAQVEHTYHIFPDAVKMSAITIISSMHYVGAGSIANVIGGVLYNSYGPRVVFRVFGITCGIWSLIMSVYFTVLSIRGVKEKTKNLEESPGKNKTDEDFIKTNRYAC